MTEENKIKCTKYESNIKFKKKLRSCMKIKHHLLKLDNLAPTTKEKKKNLCIFTCGPCSKSYRRNKTILNTKNWTFYYNTKINIYFFRFL